VVSFPNDAPEIRSVAVAEENPTSARLKVRDLDELCQLMMTMGLVNKPKPSKINKTFGDEIPATVDPSASGPAHTS
jgi:hypothetical protein